MNQINGPAQSSLFFSFQSALQNGLIDEKKEEKKGLGPPAVLRNEWNSWTMKAGGWVGWDEWVVWWIGWVMGAAAPMAPPKEENNNTIHQSFNSTAPQEIKQWMEQSKPTWIEWNERSEDIQWIGLFFAEWRREEAKPGSGMPAAVMKNEWRRVWGAAAPRRNSINSQKQKNELLFLFHWLKWNGIKIYYNSNLRLLKYLNNAESAIV